MGADWRASGAFAVMAALALPAAAIGLEIGESLTSAPALRLRTASASDARTLSFATVGTINVSVVCGR